MKFTVYQDSRRGGRKTNQDRVGYSYSRDALLLVLADGMGGHLHGEVAAQIAVELISDQFQKKARPVLSKPSQFLIDALNQSHEAIFNYAASHNMIEVPRTTCVACVIQDGVAYWAHVGDSRLYLIRNNKAIGKTRDHSKVRKLVDAGLITDEEALHHAEKNKIYNCLGGHYPPEIELSGKQILLNGDVILLCSDGMWGELTDDEMIHFLSSFPVLFAIPQLMDRAEMRGGKESDNLTALGINWHEDEEHPVASDEFISTQRLDEKTITTHISTLKAGGADQEVTEEDIEKAIQDIQNALKKYSI